MRSLFRPLIFDYRLLKDYRFLRIIFFEIIKKKHIDILISFNKLIRKIFMIIMLYSIIIVFFFYMIVV